MSLDMKIEKSTDSQKSVSEKLLDAYLEKAVSITRLKGPVLSNMSLSKEAKKDEWQGIKPEDVQKRQKVNDAEVYKAERENPTWMKAGYALGMNGLVAKSAFVASGFAMLPVTVAATMSGGEPTLVAAASASAVMLATGFMCASNPDYKEEDAAFDRYVEVKHTQMALKKLAKSLEKQEAKEKETGKGVKAAVIAKAGYAR